MAEKKTITLQFDASKKLKKVKFMNTIANVVQIMATDPTVGFIEFQFYNKKVLKESYEIKVQ